MSKKALLFSLLIHGLLVAVLAYFLSVDNQMQPSGLVEIVMIGDGGSNDALSNTHQKKPAIKGQLKSKISDAQEGQNSSVGEAKSVGAGGDSHILAQIRKKIEAAKIFPAKARELDQSGLVKLSFKLDVTGRPTDISIIKSSGYQLLDLAAQQAVLRAAPYPNYSEPIAFSMQFILESP